MAGLRPGELRGVPQGHGWEPIPEPRYSIYFKLRFSKSACSFYQNCQKTSSRWPKTLSPLPRSSRTATTLSSPPKLLERLWPTPLPSERRLTSPPWTARSSRFVGPSGVGWLWSGLRTLLTRVVSMYPQCTVSVEGGKMVCKTGKFCHTQELKGGEMIEVQWISTHRRVNICKE